MSILLQIVITFLEFSTTLYYYLPFFYLRQFSEIQTCPKSGLAGTLPLETPSFNGPVPLKTLKCIGFEEN